MHSLLMARFLCEILYLLTITFYNFFQFICKQRLHFLVFIFYLYECLRACLSICYSFCLSTQFNCEIRARGKDNANNITVFEFKWCFSIMVVVIAVNGWKFFEVTLTLHSYFIKILFYEYKKMHRIDRQS